jgi:hypothetical protein
MKKDELKIENTNEKHVRERVRVRVSSIRYLILIEKNYCTCMKIEH